jgi:hypothetical protein
MSNPMHGYDDRSRKIGMALERLGRRFADDTLGAVMLTGFRVKGPTEGNAEFLLILWGLDHEGGPVVAFQSALELDEVFRGADNRMGNGTMKWRVDEYATR